MKIRKVRHKENESLRKHNSLITSFAVLFVGLIMTFGIANYVRGEEDSQAQKEFVLACNDMKIKTFTRINLHLQFLLNASSFFESSELVTREEWKQFNKFAILNDNFMGVEGFGYAAIVGKQQLKKHIHDIRKEGFPQYTVHPAQNRTIYTSILYLEPLTERNRRALGFDMFLDLTRRKAMEQARDSNMPVLSGKVVLRQETKKDVQVGTLIYVPVYKNAIVNTIAERRAAIIGWVFSPFRMDDLMKSILGSWEVNGKENIRLQIYDGAAILEKDLLFDSHKGKIKTIKTKINTRTLPIVFNNKKWTLVFSQPSENAFFFSSKTRIIAIGGTIISLLLFALSYSLLITRQRALSIARRLSLDLSIKNKEYERINFSLNKNYGKLISSREKLKETNKKLEKAKSKAEESDQLKSAFLANMSHEIRTPMNGIMGFAELLNEANLSSAEQKSYIGVIEKSGARLLSIINDIIDISKIEAGQMNVVLSTINVEEQMHYIKTFFTPEVQEKGLDLVLKSSSKNDVTLITTDQDKLYAILMNLVKNAIKFTIKGTIEFGFEKKDNEIEFYVKDTGIGISKGRQQAIFERFIQADFNDKMARQGAGLGLSIAKAYVELLGGKIWLESKPEKGSVFYFTLPCLDTLEGNNDIPINSVKSEVDCNTEKLKILIAEDDNISRILITKATDCFSKLTLIAQTGLEAVEICQKNPDIDLILMDIQMPEMNGYEATMEIRKYNKKVIIIAQTAFALEGDKQKAIQAGCNGYISKPIKKEELSKVILHYFGNQVS